MRSWLPSGLLSSRAQNPCPRTPACQRKPGARKTKGGAPEGGPFSRRGAPPSGAIARCQPCRARRPKQFRRGLCAAALVPKAWSGALVTPVFIVCAPVPSSFFFVFDRAKPREPDNTEFGTNPTRQKRGRKSNLLEQSTIFLSILVQMHFQEFKRCLSSRIGSAQKPGVFRLGSRVEGTIRHHLVLSCAGFIFCRPRFEAPSRCPNPTFSSPSMR